MKAKVLLVVSLLGVSLTFVYFYISKSADFTSKTKYDDEVTNLLEQQVLAEEQKNIKEKEKGPYPYLTRCSMWNTQPPPARWPRWISQNDSSCPRYAYVPFNPYGGLGHKTDNFMNGLILSSALNFTYVMATDFEVSKKHTAISGAVRKLGFGAYSPLLGSIPTLQEDFCSFRSYKDYVHYILKVEGVDKCNTTYTSCEYYTDDRSPVRWHMAHMVQSRLASKRTKDVKYDRNKFNIAVHVRYGSFSPFPEFDQTLEIYNKNSSNTVRMIKYFTTELEQIGVPYAVHFFTAGEVKEDLLSAFPGAIVHGKDMSVPDTIQHFIESDLLFCLMSSMCRAASIMSTRPLVVNGYPTAEAFFYEPCPRGLSCDIINRTAEPDLALKKRIRDAGERWLVSHMLNCPVE